VTTGPHGDLKTVSLRELDCVQHIVGVSTPDNERGPSLRLGIPEVHAPRTLIARVRGENEASLELGAECREGVRFDVVSVRDLPTAPGRDGQCAGGRECLLDELSTILTTV